MRERMRERIWLKESAIEVVRKSSLRWMGHVLRLEGDSGVRRAWSLEVDGETGRGRKWSEEKVLELDYVKRMLEMKWRENV